MLQYDMDFGQVQDMEFPSDLVSFSTKLPSKRQEKIPVTFFTGLYSIFVDVQGTTGFIDFMEIVIVCKVESIY